MRERSLPTRDSGDLARLLLGKADTDLDALEVLIDSAVDDAILGFHAQQTVEKSLKAVLASKGVEYERTHDLEYLLELLQGAGLKAPAAADELAALTQWAVRFRYEAEVPSLDRPHALSLARRARDWAQTAISAR